MRTGRIIARKGSGDRGKSGGSINFNADSHLQVANLTSVELPNIHGALVAINELACIYRAGSNYAQLSNVSNNARQVICADLVQIFASLRTIRPSVFTLPGSDLLLEAACNVITNAACEQVFTEKSNVDVCSRILDLSMKSRKEEVQSAAASAFGAMSRHRDCTADIKR